MKRLNGTILHVIGALVAGGAERLVGSLLRSLAEDGYANATLLVLSHRSDDAGRAMLVSLRNSGVAVHLGPTVRVGALSVWWYVRQMRQIQPDIVHLHTPNTELMHSLAQQLLSTRPRIVRTLHSTLQPSELPTLRAYRTNRAEVSIACSRATEKASVHLVSGRIAMISNGVAFDYPLRTPAETLRCRIRLGLRADRFHFLMVGRMTESKAHADVLAAWKFGELGDAHAELHLVGDGERRPALQAAVANDDSVHFHGVRSDVADWLIACDCLVMPSRHEGLPIAGIEACGAGLPCIFSDIAPFRELDPPSALWVAAGDIGGLAEQMQCMQLMAPVVPAAEVGRFRSIYAIQRTAAQYAALYAEILPHRGRELTNASHG